MARAARRDRPFSRGCTCRFGFFGEGPFGGREIPAHPWKRTVDRFKLERQFGEPLALSVVTRKMMCSADRVPKLRSEICHAKRAVQPDGIRRSIGYEINLRHSVPAMNKIDFRFCSSVTMLN